MSAYLEMTAKIRVLSDKIVSQIAAGEVIEGPYAVLKELVENSLDAGTLSISIALENGGKSLVRVTDDGEGMSEDDLKMAFHHHSTSKISTLEQLETISTLGFRGEALASIASVARVEAMSCRRDGAGGNRIVVEGGKQIDFSPAGCAVGTVVTMRDLFYNVPARRKFLKSAHSEADKCMKVIRALALSRPNVEWTLYGDERKKFKLPPASLKQRIADLVGKEFREGLLEVELVDGPYRITGYTCDKTRFRKSRLYQFLFLNGRRITDRKLPYSIQLAYEKMMEKGFYPCYFLFLEMEPGEVDVNVHPAKLEVRFRREREVFNFVKRAVHKALGTDSILSSIPPDFGKKPDFRYRKENRGMRPSDYGALNTDVPSDKQFPPTETESLQPIKPIPESAHSTRRKTDSKAGGIELQLDLSYEPEGEKRFIPRNIFQINNKYIVTQVKDGIVLFDQHAAHERILYEKALNALSAGKAPSQRQIFTRLIEFSPIDEQIFQQLLPHLAGIGFGIKLFGPRTFLIESVPAGVKIADEVSLLRDMMEYYQEYELKDRTVEPVEAAAAAFACHAAVKSGQKLTPEEMVELIEQLHRTSTPFACPHGRPTYIQLKIEELDRLFERA